MDAKRHEESLSRLSAAYKTKSPDGSTKSLNISFRKALRLWTAHERLGFKQDDLGNIYITRTGRDSDLASIALTFPLDSRSSLPSFTGAFQTFLNLQSRGLVCDVTLLGWTSPGGKAIGQTAWEGSMSKDEVGKLVPDLQQFANMDPATAFAISAAFEVLPTEDVKIILKGSPILVAHVCRDSEAEIGCKEITLTARRAPMVSIRGAKAVPVAEVAVDRYSEYVAALFDNFD